MSNYADPNLRVASVADDHLIPAHWTDYSNQSPSYDFVWLIDNATDLPVEVEIIDTVNDKFAVGKVLIIDPLDKETWTIAAADLEWQPFPDPEGE